MTTVINPDDVRVIEEGDGWRLIGLADGETFGVPAMIARRWVLSAGAQGPQQTMGDHDQLLYIIRGDGTAVVDGETFRLKTESVLWLEPGEQYHFVAGPAGLEILQGYAPGE